MNRVILVLGLILGVGACCPDTSWVNVSTGSDPGGSADMGEAPKTDAGTATACDLAKPPEPVCDLAKPVEPVCDLAAPPDLAKAPDLADPNDPPCTDDDHGSCDKDDTNDNDDCSCAVVGHGKGSGHCKDQHRIHSHGHGNGHCKYDCR